MKLLTLGGDRRRRVGRWGVDSWWRLQQAVATEVSGSHRAERHGVRYSHSWIGSTAASLSVNGNQLIPALSSIVRRNRRESTRQMRLRLSRAKGRCQVHASK